MMPSLVYMLGKKMENAYIIGCAWNGRLLLPYPFNGDFTQYDSSPAKYKIFKLHVQNNTWLHQINANFRSFHYLHTVAKTFMNHDLPKLKVVPNFSSIFSIELGFSLLSPSRRH
jgi:hypothetical protein